MTEVQNIDQKILAQIEEMRTELATARGAVNVSSFWGDLGANQIEQLRRYGFEQFKRTINFKYGQWSISVPFDPKFLWLLARTVGGAHLPLVALQARFEDEGGPIQWEIPNPMAPQMYKLFVGLLWQWALREDTLGVLNRVAEPRVGAPINITYRGKLLSQDLAQSALELNYMARFVDMEKLKKVAEIGAGYGRLAFAMCSMFPGVEYNIIDIPPALAVAQTYLARALGEERVRSFKAGSRISEEGKAPVPGIRACLAHQLEQFPDGYFDLIINISSFDEMSETEVRRYFDLIERKCTGCLYLRGFASRTGRERARAMGISQFPYRPGWKLLGMRRDAVQARFVEVLYDLRGANARQVLR